MPSISKILLVDDHKIVIEGIKSLLLKYDRFDVVGEAQDGQEAVELVRQLQPDIVIMDISMSKLNGIEATTAIKKEFPDIHVLIYTMHSDEPYIIELFKAGISGYVTKDRDISELILALESIQADGAFFSSIAPKALIKHMAEPQKSPAPEVDLDYLSRRELQVFQLLADGQSIRAIAENLFISPKTVESHKYNIMGKLKVHNIQELTKLAIKLELIEP